MPAARMIARRLAVASSFVGILLLVPSASGAQRKPGGAAVDSRPSLLVDSAALAASAHGKLVCVACHTSLDPKAVPYPTRVEPVNCLRCHASAQFKHAFHPELSAAIRASRAPRVACKDCHGTHEIVSPGMPGSKFGAGRLSATCGACHKKALEAFRSSAHGGALAASVKGAPTCLGCHRQTITRAGLSDSLAAKTAQAQACLACHADKPAMREATSASAGFIANWAASPHGSALQRGDGHAANCVTCHGSHEVRKAKDAASPVSGANLAATCATCHASNVQKFSRSAHALALSKGDTAAPACSTCHGEHPRPGPAATGAPAGGPPALVCSRCHGPVALLGRFGIASDQFQSFTDSYHGFAVRGSTVLVANCASCHDPHDVKPPTDPASGVNKANRPSTCGTCHKSASDRLLTGPVHAKTDTQGRTPANRS